MNRLLNAIFVLGILCVNGFAGFGRGNGGDSVFCRPSSANELSGNYSLDFILTQTGVPSVPVQSWNQSAHRILSLLAQKSPFLFDSFKDFLKYQNNYVKYQLPRVWEVSKWGLKKLRSNGLVSYKNLPPNCLEESSNHAAGDLLVRQAVVRLERPEQVLYQYDPEILNDLSLNRPLQMSFLMVHEWLWDISNDVEALRRFNFLLHSSEFESLDSQQFARAIDAMGLRNSTDRVGVCARSSIVRAELEALTGKSCEAIHDFENLTKQPELTLMDANVRTLKNFDLQGLSGLKKLNLFAEKLLVLPEWFFAGVPALRELNLRVPAIENIYERSFEGLDLLSLTIAGNRNLKLPETLFSRTKQTSFIILRNFSGESFPSKLFSEVQFLVEVFFTNTKWSEFPSELIENSNPLVQFDFCAFDFSQAQIQRASIRFGSRVVFKPDCENMYLEPLPPKDPHAPVSTPKNPAAKNIWCDAKCVDSRSGKALLTTSAMGRDKNESFTNLMDACDRFCGRNRCEARELVCREY